MTQVFSTLQQMFCTVLYIQRFSTYMSSPCPFHLEKKNGSVTVICLVPPEVG